MALTEKDLDSISKLMDKKIEPINLRLDKIDKKFNSLDKRVNNIEKNQKIAAQKSKQSREALRKELIEHTNLSLKKLKAKFVMN